MESRCTAFVTSQIWRVATKWDILTHAQDTINWLQTKTFHNQTTLVDLVPSAVGTAYRIDLASQNDFEFENGPFGYSLSYFFTTSLAQLNSDLNQGASFNTLWNVLVQAASSSHPLNAHKMTQVIFGLLGPNVFGY